MPHVAARASNSATLLVIMFAVVLCATALATLVASGERTGAPADDCRVQRGGDFFPTLAAALAAAQDGDTLRIAGTCVEHDLSITRTLTLEGGWSADFTQHDPLSFPTTLDAGSAGRVLAMAGQPGAPIAPTLRDLRLINGDATTATVAAGSGGCLYAIHAAPTLTNNTFSGCVANRAAGDGFGGGAYVASSGAATVVDGNLFENNRALTATGGATGRGGGLYFSGMGTLSANRFTRNRGGDSSDSRGAGGGLYLVGGPATLTANTIESNLASRNSVGYGGGLHLENPAAGTLLSSNIITANVASQGDGLVYHGIGGGVYQANGGLVTWDSNQIVANQGNPDENGGTWGGGLHLAAAQADFTGATVIRANYAGPYAGLGGGIYIVGAGSVVTLTGAEVTGNVASAGGSSNPALGGGVYLGGGRLIVRECLVEDNRATGSRVDNQGAGIYVAGGVLLLERSRVLANTMGAWSFGVQQGAGLAVQGGEVTVINNFIGANWQAAAGAGAGVGIFGAAHVHLLHNTMVANRGAGGVTVAGSAQVTLTNTIVASHTVGVVHVGGVLTQTHTLFWLNTDDGVTGVEPRVGDPQFVDAGAYDYHIGAGSSARAAGVSAGVPDDIDGDLRSAPPDIGADELPALATPTPSATATGTATPSPTPSATATGTATPSSTLTPLVTASVTVTPNATPTGAQTPIAPGLFLPLVTQ